MATVDTGLSASKQMVHTETRSPVEAVIARVVYFVFGAIEILIAARFLLLLFGANAAAGFVAFIYGLSGFFMAPFNAVFQTQTAAGATFEWSALVALAVYALIAWGIVVLIRTVNPRSSSDTVERVEQTQDTTSEQTTR
jgi:membrane-bound ClpP family serine protease